jgi:predicted Zn finger-like uncharacterized protein
MSEIRFSCPGCDATLRVSDPALAGKKVKCPKCGNITIIPAPDAKAPAVPPPVPAAAKAAVSGMADGSRVFAQWSDGFWYPATVRSSSSRGVMVEYDDGEPGNLALDRVRELRVAEGDRIQCRWQGGPAYFPGKVAKCGGEKVLVHYDDGEKETTTLSMVRVIREEDIPWQVGDRVVANWPPEPFFYPATITKIDSGFISVDYDDGAHADLVLAQVLPLDIGVGDVVYARWKGGPAYYPGRIKEMTGDRIHVAYDDGEEEWTTIKMVRVLPADKASE